MRVNHNILFFSIVLSLVLSSCVKERGDFKATLNIVSLINPDEAFEVIVQKTAPALGNHDNLQIDNAQVYIINNETQQISLLNYVGDGLYKSNGVKPIPGYDYEIQVKVPGFDEAFATTYVPDLGNVFVDIADDQEGKENLTFSFSANILSGSSSNYFAYELVYSGEEEEEEEEEVDIETPPSNTPPLNGVFRGDKEASTLLPIVGAVTDGSTTTVNSTHTKTPRGEVAELKDISLRIVAVSAQYYDYLMFESDPESGHYSSVYVNESDVFTNYVGGAYGLFGGYNDKIIKLVE